LAFGVRPFWMLARFVSSPAVGYLYVFGGCLRHSAKEMLHSTNFHRSRGGKGRNLSEQIFPLTLRVIRINAGAAAKGSLHYLMAVERGLVWVEASLYRGQRSVGCSFDRGRSQRS
jgi:hypothetical protein